MEYNVIDVFHLEDITRKFVKKCCLKTTKTIAKRFI